MTYEPRHRAFQALLLLHILAFAALGVFGVVRLFMAYLGNAVELGTLLIFAFGAAAGLSAWAFSALSSRNPLRNRRAMLGIALLAWVDVGLLLLAVPTLFYRLRAVPLSAWAVVLPTAAFAVLATRALLPSRRHGVVPPEGTRDAA